MKEYIEREAALVEIRNLYPGIPFVKALSQRWHEDNKAYMMCENAVEAIPAADVVEVVRCKDCRYYLNSSDTCELIDTRLQFYNTDKIWTEDSFCAWGERREEEEQ